MSEILSLFCCFQRENSSRFPQDTLELFLSPYSTLLVVSTVAWTLAGDINVRVACIDVLGALATRIRKLQLAKPASSSSIPQVEAGRGSTLLADLFHRSKADPPAADAFCAWSCRFAAAGKLSQVSFEWSNSSAVTWTRKDVVDEAHEEVRFGFLPSTGLASVLDVVASSLRDPSARLRAKGLMSMSEIGRVDPRQFRQGSTFRTAVEVSSQSTQSRSVLSA